MHTEGVFLHKCDRPARAAVVHILFYVILFYSFI